MGRKEQDDWMKTLDRRVMGWLWRPNRPRRGPAGWGMLFLQSFYLAGRSAFLHRLPFQANALTFISLLALVPALAISFALAKGLGFSDGLQQLLVDNEFFSSQHEVFQQIIGYVQRTKVGTLGAVGVVLLVFTLILTISSVEETFNRIWQAPGQRSWYRKFTDYLSVMVVCPLLIFAASGAWATFSSHDLVRWALDVAVLGSVASYAPSLGPLLILVSAFVFIYKFLPNTRVPFTSALWAGVTAAALWWGAQTAYIVFQVGVARYNAIYGGFASLPLFMIWMQVSWTVVLFGAELAHAHYLCRLGTPPPTFSHRLSPAQREAVGLRLVLMVARRFHRGLEPVSLRESARELEVPVSELATIAAALEEAGLLVKTEETKGLLPGRSLESITLAQVLAALRGEEGEPGKQRERPPAEEAALALLARARRADREILGGLNLLELVHREQDRA